MRPQIGKLSFTSLDGRSDDLLRATVIGTKMGKLNEAEYFL